MLVTKHMDEQIEWKQKKKNMMVDDNVVNVIKIKWSVWKEYKKDSGKEPYLVTKRKA